MIRRKEGRTLLVDFNFGSPIKSSDDLVEAQTSRFITKESSIEETEGFLCKKCLGAYEKERLVNNYDIINEELEEGGYDLNPDMDEELKCQYCLKRRRDTDAVCLVDGLPSCINCSSSKKLESTNDLNYSSLGQILNETVLLNGSITEKKKGMKRFKTEADLGSEKRNTQADVFQSKSLSDFQNSISEEKQQSTSHSRKKRSMMSGTHHHTLSLNLNSVYDNSNEETNSSAQKTKISFHEYSHKEIDNKIMHLVSPKSNMELKFKTNNINFLQIEKMCKSLDYIFENTSKISINLPIICQAPKNTRVDLDILRKLEQNGNYLLILLDDKNEFLFGLVLNTFSGKKVGKLFKKFHVVDEIQMHKANKASHIEYLDAILENVIIKNNLLNVENYFNFDLITFKFNVDNAKLNKFLTISRNRDLLSSGISFMNIYDMC
jgi:hypothetical protein